jgi:hypothetical protein
VSDVSTTSLSATRQGEQSPLILSVLPLLALFAAATVLFRLSSEDMASTYPYWEIFVPVVAVLSLFSGWGQCQRLGNHSLWYLIKQVIHWGVIIGLLYLFNVVGFRELLNDQQYTVILIGVLAAATLLAAIQMDFKLVLFALFLGYCGYVLFQPTDNVAVSSVGNLFRIAEPQSHPATVTGALAVAGFIASLVISYLIPTQRATESPVSSSTVETSTEPAASTSSGATSA